MDVVAALKGSALTPTSVEKLYQWVRKRSICVSYRDIFRELEAQGYVLAHKAHANGHNASVEDAEASIGGR